MKNHTYLRELVCVNPRLNTKVVSSSPARFSVQMLIENFRNYWSCIQTGTYAASSLSIPSDLNSRWAGRAGGEMLEDENVMKTGSLYMYIVCLLIICCVYGSLSCLLYCVFFNVFTNPEIRGLLSSWGVF